MTAGLLGRGRASALEATRARLYARLWRWHFFAAFLVIPFVLWQATTGALYLWSEWWMDVAHPSLRFVAQSPKTLPPSEQIAAALAAAPTGALAAAPTVAFAAAPTVASAAGSSGGPPGHHHGGGSQPPSGRMTGGGPAVQGILLPDDPRRSTIVLFDDGRGLPTPVFVDPHSGRVLGALPAVSWLPGLTRALHGGWPIKPMGSWLLELGDGWAMVTLLTGLYMWWPRGRGWAAALVPRLGAGSRILLRDLHACVAAWFSLVLLFFLVSALPWTDFWGNHLLQRVEEITGQVSPAGFSPGGASAGALAKALPSLDQAVESARSRGVKGTLDIRLAPWADAPLWMTNVHQWPKDDRTLQADPRDGRVLGEFANSDIPVVPRLVALGVHVHQGDLGVANLWLDTAFAAALIWLGVTGVASWWTRRPPRRVGVPPRAAIRWPGALVAAATCLCLLLPLLGASVVLIGVLDRLFGRRLGAGADPPQV